MTTDPTTLLAAALDALESARRERDEAVRDRHHWRAVAKASERDLAATKAALVQAETAAVRWRGLVGDLVHGGEFAAWIESGPSGEMSFAAAREYDEAVDAYAAHIANPTEDRGFRALVSERDAAIAAARATKAALAEAVALADRVASDSWRDDPMFVEQIAALKAKVQP